MFAMNGWLFKVSITGNEPDTRAIFEWYAAWIADRSSALAAVQAIRHHALPLPEIDKELSEAELRGFLLKQGEAKFLHAEA